MMKKILKGFTLIELIIVMAILTILMAAIMRMFKPIRETYVDATLFESQRTAQSGIIQYMNESLRFATDLGVYNESNISNAVNEFADAYCKKNPTAVKATVMNNAEVIIIDNTANAYSFNGKSCTGRLLRRKASTIGTPTLNEITGSSGGCRIVLGDAYYGENDYAIKLSKPPEDTTGMTANEAAAELLDWKASEGIKITVASTASYGQRQLQRSEDFTDSNGVFNSKLISTEGLVVCPNLSKLGGLFDVQSDADRTAVENALNGGGGGGSNPTPPTPPGTPTPGAPSSSGNAISINGITSDDTVDEWAGAGGGGGGSGGGSGGGGGGSGGYTDNASYNEINASSPGSKVYIVFLTK